MEAYPRRRVIAAAGGVTLLGLAGCLSAPQNCEEGGAEEVRRRSRAVKADLVASGVLDREYVYSIGRSIRTVDGVEQWAVMIGVDDASLPEARDELEERRDCVYVIVEEGEPITVSSSIE